MGKIDLNNLSKCCELIIFVTHDDKLVDNGKIHYYASVENREIIALSLRNLISEFIMKCYTTGIKTFDNVVKNEVDIFLKDLVVKHRLKSRNG